MSESVIQGPTRAATANLAHRVSTLFKALMESLVTAQTRRFEDTEPLLYRFPPL